MCIRDSHKFVNPLEEYEIVKVVNNTVERKLREELEILKEREKRLDNLINYAHNNGIIII